MLQDSEVFQILNHSKVIVSLWEYNTIYCYIRFTYKKIIKYILHGFTPTSLPFNA